jgi:ribosomal protein RSM22 (predicted rRNA methylase)
VILPGDLQRALDRWLSEQQGSRTVAAQNLSTAYRHGKTSSSVSLVAYVTTRLAATYAANQGVLAALQMAMPNFVPQSLLDIGTGPGTASWAAVAHWPDLLGITQCEQAQPFHDLAHTLNAQSGLEALERARLLRMSESALPDDLWLPTCWRNFHFTRCRRLRADYGAGRNR